MIPVTALSDYLYCPRKIYLRYVLKFIPVVQEPVVKGKIKHDVFDAISKNEESLILNIKPSDLGNVRVMYEQAYKELLANSISKFEGEIAQADLNKEQLFNDSFKKFLDEAAYKSSFLLSIIKQTGLFGKDLLNAMPVKQKSELFLSSVKLRLKGIIDLVEETGGLHVPIELKTGSMPREGVWPNHKIQLASYILLLNENFKSSYGFVDYLDFNVRRKVVMNAFLESEVKDLVEEIHKLFESDVIPEACGNPNKCQSCNLKEKCFS